MWQSERNLETFVQKIPADHIPDRREQIMQAALKLFTDVGYFNTSVHDIRREADVSIGAIYHHFKNKESIAKALYDDVVFYMANIMERIHQEHDSAHDRCRALISTLLDMVETTPRVMRYILSARHREFMPDEKPICSSRPFELMLRMVQEGIDNGEICAINPTVAAASVFGGTLRLINLRLDGVIEGPAALYLEDTWQCAWKSVLVGE